jgi:hypothetical protein
MMPTDPSGKGILARVGFITNVTRCPQVTTSYPGCLMSVATETCGQLSLLKLRSTVWVY